MKAYKSWLAIAILASAVLLVTTLASQPVHAGGPWYVATTGSDTNTCLSAGSPCATINGALGKALSGDTVLVATGTYTSSTGSEVVLINKNITLSGGWNATFTTQSGMATIDGQRSRQGIAVSSVTVTVDHFIIQNGNGGGIYSFTGNLTVSNSKIINNVSAGYGGGINSSGPGTFTLINSIVSGNVAYSGGGGISGYTMTIYNSIISGNTMGQPNVEGGGGGAGIYNGTGGLLTLNNSTVSDNIILGGFSGSGINTLSGAGIIVNNSTISGNSNGEGIYTFLSPVTLNNSTISNNQGYGLRGEGGAVTLQNTIIANNGISNGGDCYNAPAYNGPFNSLGYNLIRNNSNCTLAGTDLTNVDPQLGPLQDNGGSTLTQALLPGSPAINAGNPAGCTDNSGAPLPFDQRGYLRVGRCDIGAYEYGSSSSLFMTKGVMGTFQPGGLVTYTLIFNKVPNADLTNVSLHDPLPAQVIYVPNSLTVTNGTGAVNNGTAIWTGTAFSNTATVITFGAMISTTAQNMFIANTAMSSWEGYTFSAAATFDTFSNHVYLPLVARNYCSPFSDNFSNPASGWPIADDGQVRYEYLNGEYRMLVRPTDSWAGASPGVNCSDYTVAVDVRNATSTDGTYGLIFGLSDDWQQFYTFEIGPDGYYYLWRYDSGNWIQLPSGYSPSIHTGIGTNRLEIKRTGAQIKAYANNQLLINTSDGTYTGLRRMGLIATSYTQPNVDARFDNFVVCAPGCSAAASLSGAGVTSQGIVNPPPPSSGEAASSGTNDSKTPEPSVPLPHPDAVPTEREWGWQRK